MQLRKMLATMHPQAVPPPHMNDVSDERQEALDTALHEAEKASAEVLREGDEAVELNPQGAYIRRLQHLIAERNMLSSKSVGREPNRHVMIFRETR
jgi:predicted RNA-binding protein Jag